MNRGWMVLVFSLVFFGAGVWAVDGVTIDNGPYTLNPTNSLSVNFTLTDSTYLLTDSYSFNFYVSDTTSPSGSPVKTATLAETGCVAANIVAGMTCTHAFTIGTQADATKFLVLEANKDSNGTLSSMNGSTNITFDSTAPTGTITSSPALVAGGMTSQTPTITVTIAGNDVNESSFIFSLDGTPVSGAALTSGVYAHVVTTPLSEGSHTVAASVRDFTGNISSIASFPFIVDFTAPVNVSASAVTGYTNDASPDITINASDGSGVSAFKAYYKCAGSSTYLTRDFDSGATALVVSDFDVTSTANSCVNGDGDKLISIHVADGLGNGANAADVNVTIRFDGTAPATPGNFHSTGRDDTVINLAWNAVSDPTSGLDEYRIYRSTTTTLPGSPSKTIAAGTTAVADSGLATCTQYYYWIQAVDNAGNGSTIPTAHMTTETTTGCSNGNTSGNTGGNTGGGGGSGGGGGGGGGASCDVEFDIPASVYAGETISAEASGNAYPNGHFRVTPAGKATVTIQKIGTTASTWSGTFAVPNSIGTALKFVFGTDSCTASTSRTIKDPATKVTAPAAPVNTSTPTNTNTGNLGEAPALPEPSVLTFSMDGLLAMISSAGFNADNPQVKTDAEAAITEWAVAPILRMVPVEGEAGKYVLQMVFTLKNTGNKGSVKMVQDIPKTFAKNASDFDASFPMTVLKEDPLIQFEIGDLFEGQTIEIVLTTKDSYSFGVASSKLEAVQGVTLNPPLLFASGTAKPAANKEGASDDGTSIISGLVSFVGNTGPLVLGFLLILGLIFVSVRVIRNSVPAGDENPILRSSSGVRNTGRTQHTVNAPIRGRKTWSSGEVRFDD